MYLVIGLLPYLPMPSAAIIAVVSEILFVDVDDTNTQALETLLALYGIEHRRQTTIDDHLDRCADAIRKALSSSDVVFTIGSLGPTGDDITRQAISEAVGEE